MDERERNRRTRALIGDEGIRILSEKSVAVFGLGGVGSACAEALARSGIGTLALVDFDTVELSNLNRQLVATTHTLGMNKTDAMRERVLAVSPQTAVICHNIRYTPETSQAVDLSKYDFVIDCIDMVGAKTEIAAQCLSLNLPEISCMGVGNRFDPLLLRIGDIKDAVNDPLASAVRRSLRKHNIAALRVLYSEEPPVRTSEGIVGSSAFVPPAAGLAMAGFAVRNMLNLSCK